MWHDMFVLVVWSWCKLFRPFFWTAAKSDTHCFDVQRGESSSETADEDSLTNRHQPCTRMYRRVSVARCNRVARNGSHKKTPRHTHINARVACVARRWTVTDCSKMGVLVDPLTTIPFRTGSTAHFNNSINHQPSSCGCVHIVHTNPGTLPVDSLRH